jgi:hypothetical protein
MAVRIIRGAPAEFVLVHFRNSLATLLPAGTAILQSLGLTTGSRGTLSVIEKRGLLSGFRYYFQGNEAVAVLLIPELVLMTLCYGGFLVWAFGASGRLFEKPATALIVVLIPTFLFLAGAGSVPRYRMSVEALIDAGAGAGFARVLRRRNQLG